MRGADAMTGTAADVETGSSPHAWGRLSPDAQARFRAAVHPHMRGADASVRSFLSVRPAVHPHMRGADFCNVQGCFHLGRFIPTCVGQTYIYGLTDNDAPVHPHMRGADAVQRICCRYTAGSSPHAWGRLMDVRFCDRYRRFIPTCVGQTAYAQARIDSQTVHPHMRGADEYRKPDQECYNGSSPHAWGRRQNGPGRRSIPPVHPHMRGADA